MRVFGLEVEGSGTWTGLPPSYEAVDNMADVQELKERRQEGVGQPQKKDVVDQSVLVVEVVLDQDVSDQGNQDRIHQLSHNRLQSITDLPVRSGKISLVNSHRLYCNYT